MRLDLYKVRISYVRYQGGGYGTATGDIIVAAQNARLAKNIVEKIDGIDCEVLAVKKIDIQKVFKTSLLSFVEGE